MEWYSDPDWLKTPVKLPGSDKWDTLKNSVLLNGLLASINGQDIGYVDTLNMWVPIVSDTYSLRAMQLMGNDNASVQYVTGFKAYMPLIEKGSSSFSVPSCPLSVCVGTRRLLIEWSPEDSCIVFQDCPPLLKDIAPKLSFPDYVYGLCNQPATHTCIPSRFSYPSTGGWYRHVEPFFPDKRSLVTYLWTIGNSIVDPISRPRCLLLCGPGGSGKSTALRGAKAALGGCCGLLPDNVLLKEHDGKKVTNSVAAEVATAVVSARMVVCFEMDLESSLVNMSILKNVTGGDFVKIGTQMTKALSSMMIATNGLPNHERQPEFFSDALMRRMVLVQMPVDTSQVQPVPDPSDPVSKVNLLCNAIAVRLMYHHMPVSPMNVLLTLTGDRYFEMCKYIEESPTGVITQIEGRDVVCFLAVHLRCTSDQVVSKAKFISPMCVESTPIGSVIKGLRMI